MGSRRWSTTLRGAAEEACLAARLYNDPSETRSFEAFIVHMHLAWLYLLHAEFIRDKIDFRYRDKTNPHRLEKVDGEAKRWELAKCVRTRWPDANDPVRANIEFFIALRNKIEHRYPRFQAALMIAAAGHAQALLLNFENELRTKFGDAYSLAAKLRFPVFIGTFTKPGEDTLRELYAQLPASLRTFIASYHSGLDPKTQSDPRFEFRIRVTMELASRDGNGLAIQYTRLDDMSEDQRIAVEAMGKKGQVVIREQNRPVQYLDWLKPSEVVSRVASAIPFRFNMHTFQLCWKALKVRPEGRAKHPERTTEQYCLYDRAHNDYIYSGAYVKKLIRELSTAAKYTALLGIPAIEKQPAIPRQAPSTAGAPGADEEAFAQPG